MKLPDLEQLRRALATHELEQVQDGLVTAYYLKQPGQGRMMSTLIVFSPECISLTGDLTPERNGSVSAYGYGAQWFSGFLSASYLCEKFLTEKWCQDIARDRLKDEEWLKGMDYTAEQIERMEELSNQLDDMGPEGLRDALEEIGYQCDDGVPGFGYDRHEAALLVAIQEAFAREFGKAAARGKAGVER